jgi:signal transduction histidine kinase
VAPRYRRTVSEGGERSDLDGAQQVCDPAARLDMAWLLYTLAWLAAAVFWSISSAGTAGSSPIEMRPWGLLTMGTAGILGLGCWHLTRYVAWDWRAPATYVVHAAALVLYSTIYATSWVWIDVLAGRTNDVIARLRSSPTLGWNLMMGSWLYVLVTGVSYAIRAHRRVHAEETAAADARLLAEQAQLSALRAQVNPHFLFNALHSVGALVAMDAARAEEAIERLGDLLRYSLRSEHAVLLAEEWKFTQDYLAFERLRLGDRLGVDADADAAALAAIVPPLILQPLVENAVRHGIADRPAGGHITMSAHATDGWLRLRVVDDGPGPADAPAGGVGLASVRRRLAATYGDRGRLEMALVGAGFAVTMTLPLITGDGMGPAA